MRTKHHGNNLNQLKLGSVLSYLQMGIGILVQLLITPVMIRLLGSSEYGLYNTATSTISMLGILSLGFGSGYIRYYAIYRKNGEQESIYRLNGLMLLIFCIIGIIGLICGLFLTSHLEMVFDKGLTEDEYKTAQVLMLLLTINLTISFPMSVFTNIIFAHERFIFLKLVGMIKTVLCPLINLPLLLMGFRSVALVSVSVGFSFITDILYLYYVLIRMKEKFVFSNYENGLLRGMFKYTFFIALNSIIDQINWNIDKVLLARFMGTVQVAIYSVGYTLFGTYMSFSVAISDVFTPRVFCLVNDTKEMVEYQRKKLTDLFTSVGRIQFILLGLIASGIVFFGKYFITRIWAGAEYYESYWVALLLILPASIPFIQNIGIEIQRAENKHQFRAIVYTAMAVLNLGVSIVLCQRYGAIGSAIGTAFSLLVANGLVMNVYYQKKCNIDICHFWKSIIRLSRGMLIPIVIGLVCYNIIQHASLLAYFGMVIGYIAIYLVSMWTLGMNDFEKKLIESGLNKMLRRRS